MCDPFSVATIYAATAGVQADTQKKAASSQAKATRAAAAQQRRQVAKRQVQEERSASQRKQAITDDAQAALSTATVSAAEGGVGGSGSPVVAAIARDIRRQRLEGINAVDDNLAATQDQLQEQQAGITAQANRQINAINPGPGIGLALGPALIQGAATGAQLAGNLISLSPGSRA